MKRILNLVLAASMLLSYQPLFANAVIFSGNDVKALKQNLDLNGSVKVLSGNVDPSSSATSAPVGSIYLNNSNGLTYRKLDAGSSTNWVVIGSGSSTGKNYISNPGAEANTTGWSAYADSGAVPVDCTGGSPTVAVARTTSSPLSGIGSFTYTKDAANRQGEGISTPFTIDAQDQAKVLTVKLENIVSSGTFAAGSSSSDSDVMVYLYDVSNSALIYPSTSKFFSNSTTLSESFESQFQTPSNSTSFRLCIHSASTSASAYTLKLDSISVSPSQYVYGTPITDFTTFTPTGSWSTNTTYTGRWRRVGDSAEIEYKVSTTGAPTSAALTVNMPTGLVIDSSKLADINTGATIMSDRGHIHDTGTKNFDIAVLYNSTTAFSVHSKAANDTYVTTPDEVTQSSPMTWANGDSLGFTVKVPIVGWSSSVQTSDSADTRVVAFRARTSTTAATTSAPFIFTTVQGDTHSMYNSSNGIATVPVSGWYQINANVYTNSTFTLRLYINGTIATQFQASGTSGQGSGGADLRLLNAGDTVQVRPDTSATASAVNQELNFFSMYRVTGPSAIAASETIAFSANTSTTAATTSAAFVFSNELTDTHSWYNNSTGVATIPTSGIYLISWHVYSNAASWVSNLYVNGVSFAESTEGTASNATSGSVLRRFSAGDTIEIRPSANRTASGGASATRFSAVRMGL